MPRLRKWSESEKQFAMPDFKTCKKNLQKNPDVREKIYLSYLSLAEKAL